MSENVVLRWENNSYLKWSDFKAESNPAVFEDSHSVIKYRFTWTVNSDNVDGEIKFLIEDIQVSVDFNPLLSWVRISELNDDLLNHEQGCFDLAELVKRENIAKLEGKFYSKHFSTRGKNEEQQKQFAKEDSGKMIAEEVEKLQQLYDEKCRNYQDETKFSHDAEQQSKYNLSFKSLRS